MFTKTSLRLVMDWVTERCLSKGLIDEVDQEFLRDSEQELKKLDETKTFSWWWFLAAVIAYCSPATLLIAAVVYVGLLLTTAAAYFLLTRIALNLDRAVVRFLRLVKLTDHVTFALEKEDSQQSPVMEQERLKLLSIMRRACGTLDELSRSLVVTKKEDGSLWSKVMRDDVAALLGLVDESTENFIDFTSLKTLRSMFFLYNSQFLALSIRRLTLCTCDADDIVDGSMLEACGCSDSSFRSLTSWMKRYYLVMSQIYKLIVLLGTLRARCPVGQVRKVEQHAPARLSPADALFMRAKANLFVATDRIQSVSSLADVPQEIILSLKEVISILEIAQKKRCDEEKPLPETVGLLEQRKPSADDEQRGEDVVNATRDIPDYEIFEGAQREDDPRGHGDAFFDDDDLAPIHNPDIMKELTGAIAGQAREHNERVRIARQRAGLPEEELVDDEGTSSDIPLDGVDDEAEDFDTNAVFVPSLLEELNLFASRRRTANQEEMFGDDGDSASDAGCFTETGF
ncbi:hypothetical protein QR680_011827 [Steinernema hermaphroditum]|uniref:Vezatin n=1 Tax=Steinernema hermaphroditum TaxID=289476 RepID=A0AA39LZE7_9BILA|nr:hypothetical protein QR680_011827 [Steinernema hermaphroditum]